MGFPGQEYWSGLPFPSSGDLPDPGIKPRSPALKADSLLSHQGSPLWQGYSSEILECSTEIRKTILYPCASWITDQEMCGSQHFFFFLRYFWCGPFFKSLYWICCSIDCLVYFMVFWLRGMWDLSLPTRDQTHTSYTGRWSLNHWIAREVFQPTF